jgi:hypothetical protein
MIFRRILSWQAVRVLVWVVTAFVIAVVVNVVGIRLVGDIGTWERWLASHRAVFFAWRLCLYAGVVWSWWTMHRQICAREPDRAARARLWRVEIAAVLTVLTFETVVLLR